jgi:tetratricopeptide (TPR) repeat protein
MNDRTNVVKRSQIAAAKLKVAIADRKGEPVPDWIRELASRSLSESTVERQSRSGESTSPAPSSEPQEDQRREQEDISDPSPVLSVAPKFGMLADIRGGLQAPRDLIRAAAHQSADESKSVNGATEMMINRGQLLEKQGNATEAERVYQSAIDSGHADAAPMATVGLGTLLEGQGDVAGAKAAYQLAIDSGHADAAPIAAVGLGTLLEGQGDVAGAKAAYQLAIDSGHADAAPAGAVGLGTLLAKQGDVAGAKTAYQLAIDSGDAEMAIAAERFLSALE